MVSQISQTGNEEHRMIPLMRYLKMVNSVSSFLKSKGLRCNKSCKPHISGGEQLGEKQAKTFAQQLPEILYKRQPQSGMWACGRARKSRVNWGMGGNGIT